MDISYIPYFDSGGEVTGVVMTAHDLTSHKKIEQALEVSEEALRDLVENINDVIYALDEKACLTYLRPQNKRLARPGARRHGGEAVLGIGDPG
jgi:PAS domain-containing protein